MTEPISRALQALLDLMVNSELADGQRLEAAKAIIEYEAPQAVFDLTHEFLLMIAEGENVELTLRALQLVRKVEARRVAPPPAQSAIANKETAERLGRARLRLDLIGKGEWPTSEAGWTEGTASPTVEMSAVGLAERLKAARGGGGGRCRR